MASSPDHPRSTRTPLEERIAELEAALADAEAGGSQYRELFERSADAILLIDGETFIDCNAATVAMLRYRTRDELLQTHPSELSPEFQADGRPSFEKANEMMETALANGSHRFEWLHRRADGEVFPVEVLLTAVPQGERTILHTVWRDITDRVRLEEELRQAQKMEAVGKLAGGIAHDFNNLLMAISGNAELLQIDLGSDPAQAENVAEILRASGRAASLIEQLLAYSRKQIMQPRVLDISDVFSRLDKMLDRLLGEDIDIVMRLAPGPLPVLVDPGQLEQVVINLATNARDAMPDGGVLTFSTSRMTVGPRPGGDSTLLGPGPYAVLAVQDTGQGIPSENLNRVFDPFFTTKEQGQGTGLGLSTVYGIVKQSGGDVTVSCDTDRGTVFQVMLPLSPQPSTGPRRTGKKAAASRDLRGSETILLVEDEPTLARLVEKVLTANGYTVFTAGDGLEALTLIETTAPEFDLLLTDVIMPRIGGPELADRLQKTRPHLKVLFMSGYTDSILVQKGLISGDMDLVAKPFSPAELLEKLKSVLTRA